MISLGTFQPSPLIDNNIFIARISWRFDDTFYKFCNILVVREVQFIMSGCFWPRGHEGDEPHWTVRCRALLMLLVRFVYIAWSAATASTVLELAWSLRFLQPEQNFFNHLVTVIINVFTFRSPSWHSCRTEAKINVRFELESPLTLTGPPSAGRITLIGQHSTSPFWSSLNYEQPNVLNSHNI